MLGAILGDIVGSRFEFHNHLSKDFELLTDGCFFTDDTVMTCAVAKALMDCPDPAKLGEVTVKTLREVGQPYPNCGYGGMFYRWMYSRRPKPYRSYGNGAAMRVSAVGFLADSMEECVTMARQVTEVTHDHPEGLKGAEATAAAVYMALNGADKDEIRAYVTEHYYPLDETVDEIRQHYVHNETCQATVPQALTCFLEAESYEDTLRNCVSIGGDSDTLCAIAGGIAEAYFGIPDELANRVWDYLDERLTDIVTEFYRVVNGRKEKLLEQLRESLRDGSRLLEAKREFRADPCGETLEELAQILRNSCVTIPGNYAMAPEDEAQLADLKPGVDFTLLGDLRFAPDILQDGEGKYYYPIFSNSEQMPEDYRSRFSAIIVTAKEAFRMAKAIGRLEGLVLDAFTEPFVISEELAEKIAALPEWEL